MGLYYSDGSPVGNCGTQIAFFLSVIACFIMHFEFGIGVGWTLLIVFAVSVILMILHGYFVDK